MSSAVVSTSAAQGRPFVFDEEDVGEVCPQPSGAELFAEARPPSAWSQRISRGYSKMQGLPGLPQLRGWRCVLRQKWYPAASPRWMRLPEVCRAVA